MRQTNRPAHVVVNSILRIEGVSRELPVPFEKTNRTSDVWILELPVGQTLPAWQVTVLTTFQRHARLLKKCGNAGARCFLHVQTESPVAMLPVVFEPTLLNALSRTDCALEHGVEIESEQERRSRSRRRTVRRAARRL
jgi:hypothetical protein